MEFLLKSLLEIEANETMENIQFFNPENESGWSSLVQYPGSAFSTFPKIGVFEAQVQVEDLNEGKRGYWLRMIFTVVFLTLGILGISGNALVVIGILTDSTLQIKNQLSNMMILNLAITDLATCILLCLPGALNVYLDDTPFNDFFCSFFTWANICTIGATYMTLCVITFDRFIAVGWPLHYPQYVTEQRMLGALIFCWAMAFIGGWCFSLFPALFGEFWATYDYSAGICDVNWLIRGKPWFMAAILYAATSEFLIPSFFIILLNPLIIYMSKGTSSAADAKEASVNKKILQAMMVVVWSFIILNFPVALIRLIKALLPPETSKFPVWSTTLFQVFQFMASVVNPLIYGLFRKDFRNAFTNIFKKMMGRG